MTPSAILTIFNLLFGFGVFFWVRQSLGLGEVRCQEDIWDSVRRVSPRSVFSPSPEVCSWPRAGVPGVVYEEGRSTL